MVTVFLPEYVVGHWWEHVLHNQSALRLKGRLLFMPGVMVTSVPWQLNSSERLKTHATARGSWRCASRDIRLTIGNHRGPATGPGRADADRRCAGERRQLRGPPRRPGGVRPLRVARRAGAGAGHRRPRSYWHAEAIEVIEPSADRAASLCPIAGVDGAGCCDLAFVDPAAARALKAEVVSNQLARLGNYQWRDDVQPLSPTGPTGWRTRLRLDVGADGRPGFHRYRSDDLVTDLNCGQLPAGMIDGLTDTAWPPGRTCTSSSTTTANGMWHARCATAGAMIDRRGRGQSSGRAAGRAAQLAGTGDGLLAGPPRRGADLQRPGGRLGPTRSGHDRVGSLRGRRAFRRGPGRRGRGVRTGGQCRQLASGVAGGARYVGRSCAGEGDHRFGSAGA